MNKKHIGSNFDDWLKEEGIYEQVQTVVIKRVMEMEKQMNGMQLTQINQNTFIHLSQIDLIIIYEDIDYTKQGDPIDGFDCKFILEDGSEYNSDFFRTRSKLIEWLSTLNLIQGEIK